MPTAYIYARCSHVDQLVTGESIKDQLYRCYSYNERRIHCTRVVEVKDEAVSAYRKRFMYRDGGAKILQNIKRGDFLIIDKLDRLCRNAYDFLSVVEHFKTIGVSVHICNLGGMEIDVSDGMGKLFLTIMAAIAELESSQKSERIRAALTQRRSEGKVTAYRVPIGMRVAYAHGRDGNVRKYIEWCPYSMSILRQMKALQNNGFTREQIAEMLNREHFATRQNSLDYNEYIRHKSQKDLDRKELPWTFSRVQRWLKAHKKLAKLEAKGITNAKDVAIAIHAMNKERKNGTFDIRAWQEIKMVEPEECSRLPAWAARQLDASGEKPRSKPKVAYNDCVLDPDDGDDDDED